MDGSGNRTPDQTSDGWDAAVATYEEAGEPFTALFAEEALRLVGVSAGDRILDVGAGTGGLSLAAARLGAEVDGIDFAPIAINDFKKSRIASKRHT